MAGELAIGSFWEGTVGAIAEDPPLSGDVEADVAIVGAGFTGLSAALKAASAGASVRVLEAARVGWGASGRNGGFCCMGGSKRSAQDLVARYGRDEARRFVRFQLQAIDTVEQRLADWSLDVDRHSDGETILAHRPSALKGLAEEAAFLNDAFGLGAEILSREGLADRGMAGPDFFGGMHVPHGFALNPMKYVQGLAAAARAAGAVLNARSAVTAIRPGGGRWHLQTPEGTVAARRVILAGNGYSREDVPDWLAGRLLPVLSNILVTRPLTQGELAAQGWTSPRMAADTRTLLHYFRLLPDRRFLFGMRGGIFGTAREHAAMHRRIRADFARLFPAWARVEESHFWSGHVCLALDLNPFIGEVPGWPGVFAAMAYHGNGVSMASLAGEAAANLALSLARADDLPAVVRAPLRRFPAPALRRLYLQGAYWWYGLKDR
ncbi:NAD(P)/FAD-dependent oxidoreductase [Polymorphum gilvum]|uniref:FAD dependent oxidoreductase, putative n=1 Tax=Polymorphum gilvum (strain LMG 25793 / CGMCC 1.9160 / SL003B-26A1) TaxID=991905 RepID=F2J1D6_POLGS|nr:FAD-dependent oxidoreductase [Polymorphum gilvum]ADZ69718.1 FAD dependent oxidoreductase, putative [Polymorphum gilvum SL003B-26A1]